jgi:two-component system, OmpR family, sensor histidine kinase KdpD
VTTLHNTPAGDCDVVSFELVGRPKAEIDYYWGKLSADPMAEQCGWLKDKYGLSWQIVPAVMNDMMKDKDERKTGAGDQSVSEDEKFDIAKLKEGTSKQASPPPSLEGEVELPCRRCAKREPTASAFAFEGLQVPGGRYNRHAMSSPESIQRGPAASGSFRGRLKVFLGYASGVGKSFRMFDEARRRKERGQDVVVGALQPEVPPEIDSILSSLEVIPTLDIEGVPVIDVPAILHRHPQVCIVDGLAYDNHWSHHAHRWQDVEELLENGINVVGSVNLQHIDDQREAVERLTGRPVRETIPREFLNTADEIVVVDAPTEGAPPELVSLREMALVLSADVIDAGLQRYLQAHDIEPRWRTHERFLVCLTPRANADRMITSARQSAARFHCDVLAIYARPTNSSEKDHRDMEEILAHARSAGARVDVLDADDPVESVVQYARSHGVTQIFVGHSMKNDWQARLWGTPVSRLIRAAEGMDVRVFPH